jgi:arginyl-tRNA synthetase
MKYFIEELKQQLSAAVADILGANSEEVKVEYPSDKFDADLAVPVFKFSSGGSNPQQIAESVAGKLSHPAVEKAEAISGFVNLWLKPQVLAAALLNSPLASYGDHDFLAGQQVLVEHTDPNPFKELHIGHVYSNTVGESIARLHEAASAEVVRLSYHGDVGLHIAQAVWAMGESIGWQKERVDAVKKSTRHIGEFYSEGNAAYDNNKAAIESVNRKIYSGEDDLINELYEWGKE